MNNFLRWLLIAFFLFGGAAIVLIFWNYKPNASGILAGIVVAFVAPVIGFLFKRKKL